MGKRRNRPLTSAQIEMLREHIPYRIWMLRSTHAFIGAGVFAGPVQNAIIESFAIHARALVEFYRGHRKGVKASDFADAAYEPMSKELSKPALDLTGRISSSIVHAEPALP